MYLTAVSTCLGFNDYSVGGLHQSAALWKELDVCSQCLNHFPAPGCVLPTATYWTTTPGGHEGTKAVLLLALESKRLYLDPVLPAVFYPPPFSSWEQQDLQPHSSESTVQRQNLL